MYGAQMGDRAEQRQHIGCGGNLILHSCFWIQLYLKLNPHLPPRNHVKMLWFCSQGTPRPHSDLTIHEKGSAWLSEARGLMIYFSEKPRLQMATGRAVYGPAQERPATSSHHPLPGAMWTVLRSPNSNM